MALPTNEKKTFINRYRLVYLANIGFVFLLFPYDPELKLYVSMAVTFAIFTLVWIANKEAELPDTDKEEDLKTDANSPVMVIAGIYAVVAGVALTQAFATTNIIISSSDSSNALILHSNFTSFWISNSNGTSSLTNNAHGSLSLLAYLILVLPFYHGATMVFSNLSRERVNVGKEKTYFMICVMLFSEAAFLFLIAQSVTRLGDFVVWALCLMITDSIWIAYFRLQKDTGNSAQKNKIAPRAWLQLNIPFSLFLISLIVMGILGLSKTLSDVYVLPIFLFVCIFRTVMDYKTTWFEYFPIKGKNKNN